MAREWNDAFRIADQKRRAAGETSARYSAPLTVTQRKTEAWDTAAQQSNAHREMRRMDAAYGATPVPRVANDSDKSYYADPEAHLTKRYGPA